MKNNYFRPLIMCLCLAVVLSAVVVFMMFGGLDVVGQGDDLDLHDLRFCRVQSTSQSNMTYVGEMGAYTEKCGFTTVCELECRYLSDSCITTYGCSKINYRGGYSSPVESKGFDDGSVTNEFCSGDGVDSDYCRGYNRGLG